MRLVLREYLAMLRESGELDVLIPDLLVSMGLQPLTRPGRGSRQFGVDVAAVGVDPTDLDPSPKLLLVTIKRGNITRSEWDTGVQAVRPSLNEILDSYLRTMVRPEHAALRKTVVLATGGDMRQDVEGDWNNYIHVNRDRHPQHGTVDFAFWGGDMLAKLLDTYLYDEFLFPEADRQRLRKTIAVVDQTDHEPTAFYEMIHDVLFERGVPTGKGASEVRAREKALRLIDLSLLVVFRWGLDANNLRVAILGAERALLTTWDWIRQGQLFDCPATRSAFGRLVASYRRIMAAYTMKLAAHAEVRDGFAIPDDIETALRVHEVIGHLGVFACAIAFEESADDDRDGTATGRTDSGSGQEQASGSNPDPASVSLEADQVAEILARVIANNGAAAQPRYDGHVVDIGVALLALTLTGKPDIASTWLESIAARVIMALRFGDRYPIATDSYEDLLALRSATPPSRDRLFDLSTLLPTLAEWMVVLQMPESTYEAFRQAVQTHAAKADLQIWYPDAATDALLYRTNAAAESGAMLSSIELPPSLSVLANHIRLVDSTQGAWNNVSCLREGWTWGALLASRHFRTPLIPALWESALVPRGVED